MLVLQFVSLSSKMMIVQPPEIKNTDDTDQYSPVFILLAPATLVDAAASPSAPH